MASVAALIVLLSGLSKRWTALRSTPLRRLPGRHAAEGSLVATDERLLACGLHVSDIRLLITACGPMPNQDEPKRCVIADDLRALREILRSWLTQCGFECTLARDGNEAWAAIQQDPPDLVITDIEMPHCCGLELLQRIRQDPQSSIHRIPVMVVTSLHDGQMRRAVQQLGGNALLVKPLDKQSTFSVVLEVLATNLQPEELIVSDPQGTSTGNGVVSPTLRRLLKAVAANESLRR